MNPESLAQWLAALSLQARAKALNLLSYELTVRAREYGIASVKAIGEPSALRKMVGINELQHKLVSQAGHYLDGDERTAYPVDVLSRSLFESADHYGISPALIAAIKRARAKVAPTT